MKRGKLIVIDGIDCSGKDSIINSLSLTSNFVKSREPGGTEIGEKIRNIILDPENKGMDDMTTFLLFSAARRQHTVQKIMPTLNKGTNILLNRYYYSSIIYQGILSNNGAGLPQSFISEITLNAIRTDRGIATPDLTIILYAGDFSTIENRIKAKQDKDRLELNDIKYFERVNKEYQYIFHNKAICEIEYYKKPEYLFVNISKYDGNKLGIVKLIQEKIDSIL